MQFKVSGQHIGYSKCHRTFRIQEGEPQCFPEYKQGNGVLTDVSYVHGIGHRPSAIHIGRSEFLQRKEKKHERKSIKGHFKKWDIVSEGVIAAVTLLLESRFSYFTNNDNG